MVGRLTVSSIGVPGRFAVPRHDHESAIVCVVLDGAFDERTRRGEHPCLPGTVRYSPPGDLHHIRLRESDMRCVVVALDRDDLPGSGRRVYVQSPALARLARRLDDEAGDPGCCPIVAESMAVELFAGAVRHERRRRYRNPPRWLVDVRRTLDDAASWSLSLHELGRLSGYSGAHLAVAFREHFGLTIGDYIRSRQLSIARHELLRTRAPISQVAAMAGFADQSHLTRLMRRALGTTPARLRAAAAPR